MKKGYVQVYTGNGKGKTTCMLGLTLRASGAGLRVYIGQFLKNDDYSEIQAIRKYLPQVTVEQYGSGEGFFRKGDPKEKEEAIARAGYEKAKKAATSGEFDLVICDEINVAVYMELLTEDDVLALIAAKAEQTELVLTGRYAKQAIVDRADLVTEMTMIKHYYEQGVPARVGIEK